MLEDELLKWKLRGGSQEALARVYEKYVDGMLTLAMGLLNNRAAAEDVVQDVFLSFARSARHLRSRGSLRRYLMTGVLNRVRDWRRQRQRRGAVAKAAEEPVGGGAGIFTPPTGGVSYTTNQSVSAWYWWNDSVKNYVRALDRDAYYGREDWGIKAWESRRANVTVNEFSDAGTGFDINVTVENNCQSCGTANYSVLALIMDMDAVTTTNSVPYPGGQTIYPSVSSWANIRAARKAVGD